MRSQISKEDNDFDDVDHDDHDDKDGQILASQAALDALSDGDGGDHGDDDVVFCLTSNEFDHSSVGTASKNAAGAEHRILFHLLDLRDALL